MKIKIGLLCGFWALWLASTAPAVGGRGGFAVEGVDRARILAPAGAATEDYKNSGYRLRQIEGEIHVEVDASPLISTAPFALSDKPQSGTPQAGTVARLARGLTTGADTYYEAISRILGWVSRHIEYNLDRQEAQDADAVLERRSGYCTGVARLTVALLRSVGIPAREVAGYVLHSGGEEKSGYHRWIEARLPDRGWVFSDPLKTHHYVPANYLRLSSEELVLEEGLDGLLIERQDHVATVDLYPNGVPGVTARRNSDRQLAAALRVLVDNSSSGLAELSGDWVRRTHSLVDGGTTFVGLEPGNYRLRLMLPGYGMIERQVELAGRVRKTLSLPVDLQRRNMGGDKESPGSTIETQGPRAFEGSR